MGVGDPEVDGAGDPPIAETIRAARRSHRASGGLSMTPDAVAEMVETKTAPCSQDCKVDVGEGPGGSHRTLLCEHKDACTIERPDDKLLVPVARRR